MFLWQMSQIFLQSAPTALFFTGEYASVGAKLAMLTIIPASSCRARPPKKALRFRDALPAQPETLSVPGSALVYPRVYKSFSLSRRIPTTTIGQNARKPTSAATTDARRPASKKGLESTSLPRNQCLRTPNGCRRNKTETCHHRPRFPRSSKCVSKCRSSPCKKRSISVVYIAIPLLSLCVSFLFQFCIYSRRIRRATVVNVVTLSPRRRPSGLAAGGGGPRCNGVGGPRCNGVGGPRCNGVGGPRCNGVGGPRCNGVGGPNFCGIDGSTYSRDCRSSKWRRMANANVENMGQRVMIG